MFSIVIPLYNKEAYIKQALVSVINQSYKDFEIIVVNDGSTDNSLNVAESFDDNRLRILTIENAGVSVARNTGIRLARFEWIAFLDADDWWDERFLDEIHLTLKEFPNDLIFASGRSRVFKDQIERYNHVDLPSDGERAKINYFKVISKNLPPINSSNVVIHKSLLLKNQFREGMKMHEDHDLWIRLCSNNGVVFVNKPLSFYRKSIDDSASFNLFSSRDFMQYVADIKEVKSQISIKEKNYFKKYYTSFIPIRYFQSYQTYSSSERQSIVNVCKELLSFRELIFLRLLNLISIFNPYNIFKSIKG